MISTYELELFAKQAATDFLKEGKSLNESITKIASENGLNGQQVRRVVEAANTEAYMNLFNKSDDKYVSFATADPAVIESNLSVTKVAEASVVDDSDYYNPPAYEAPVYTPVVKVAEAVPEVRSSEQVMRDYYRFKAAEAQLDNMIVESRILFSSEAEKLASMIKQAVLSGTDYSEIKAALNSNTDPVFVETLKAVEEELTSVMPMGSISKTASAIKGSVNSRHPLIQQSLRIVKCASDFKILTEKMTELQNDWELYKTADGKLKGTVEFLANHPKSFATGLALGVGGTAVALPAIASQTNRTNHSVLKQIPEMYRS